MAKKNCDHCGSSMVEYRHAMNRFLLEGLKRLNAAQNPVNLSELDLDRNQWDNFQKLRYWDLVAKSFDDKGKRIGGTWEITEKGKLFLAGKIKINSKTVTYRGVRVSFEGPEFFVSEFIESFYKQKEEYADDSTIAGE